MIFGFFNLWSACIVALLLIPNVIYALRHKGSGISSPNRAINALEQFGRFGCMIFMIVPLGVRGGEFGFYSLEEVVIWAAGMAGLLLVYYICWGFYARRPGPRMALALAAVPCGVFLLQAVVLRHWVLAVFAGVFAGAHLYIVRRWGVRG